MIRGLVLSNPTDEEMDDARKSAERAMADLQYDNDILNMPESMCHK